MTASLLSGQITAVTWDTGAAPNMFTVNAGETHLVVIHVLNTSAITEEFLLNVALVPGGSAPTTGWSLPTPPGGDAVVTVPITAPFNVVTPIAAQLLAVVHAKSDEAGLTDTEVQGTNTNPYVADTGTVLPPAAPPSPPALGGSITSVHWT